MKAMRTYIELRNAGGVLDWRMLLDPDAKAIAYKVRELTWGGMCAGDTIVVYESDETADELKLPR